MLADSVDQDLTSEYPITLTHYQTTILDSSKLKEFADDNFKFDENGKKLSKRVENTVGKGESYEQFLLFPQRFQKACFPGASKGVIVWEWVKHSITTEKEILTTYTYLSLFCFLETTPVLARNVWVNKNPS